MPSLFVSYVQQDEPIVSNIVERLLRLDYQVSRENLENRTEFFHVPIDKALLNGKDAVFAFLPLDQKRLHSVLNVAQSAFESGIPVVLLLRQKDILPPGFENYPIVRLVDENIELAVTMIDKFIKDQLNDKTKKCNKQA